jgi:hypothetical protein
MTGTPTSRTRQPVIDHHCVIALETAVKHIADQRMIAPEQVWDLAVQLPILAGLIQLAEQWVHDEVAHARDTGVSWATIGQLLGISAALARTRHTPATRSHTNRSTATKKGTPLAIH